MTLHSKIHQNIYLKPISVCVLINFITAIICIDKGLLIPFIFVFILTSSFTAVIIYLTIRNSNVLIIEGEKIIYKNDYNGNEQIFQMQDIINLKIGKTTSTKMPILSGMTVHSVIIRTKIFFILTFKNNKTLKIEHDQFSNFAEFKDYFKQYCIKNGIR